MINWKSKYLKYKLKYLKLIQNGGALQPQNITNMTAPPLLSPEYFLFKETWKKSYEDLLMRGYENPPARIANGYELLSLIFQDTKEWYELIYNGDHEDAKVLLRKIIEHFPNLPFIIIPSSDTKTGLSYKWTLVMISLSVDAYGTSEAKFTDDNPSKNKVPKQKFIILKRETLDFDDNIIPNTDEYYSVMISNSNITFWRISITRSDGGASKIGHYVLGLFLHIKLQKFIEEQKYNGIIIVGGSTKHTKYHVEEYIHPGRIGDHPKTGRPIKKYTPIYDLIKNISKTPYNEFGGYPPKEETRLSQCNDINFGLINNICPGYTPNSPNLISNSNLFSCGQIPIKSTFTERFESQASYECKILKEQIIEYITTRSKETDLNLMNSIDDLCFEVYGYNMPILSDLSWIICLLLVSSKVEEVVMMRVETEAQIDHDNAQFIKLCADIVNITKNNDWNTEFNWKNREIYYLYQLIELYSINIHFNEYNSDRNFSDYMLVYDIIYKIIEEILLIIPDTHQDMYSIPDEPYGLFKNIHVYTIDYKLKNKYLSGPANLNNVVQKAEEGERMSEIRTMLQEQDMNCLSNGESCEYTAVYMQITYIPTNETHTTLQYIVPKNTKITENGLYDCFLNACNLFCKPMEYVNQLDQLSILRLNNKQYHNNQMGSHPSPYLVSWQKQYPNHMYVYLIPFTTDSSRNELNTHEEE
tara:strand:- start:2454 stop:4553 length:2100 start_codon:yes stop_codon:yes gene_type:complete